MSIKHEVEVNTNEGNWTTRTGEARSMCYPVPLAAAGSTSRLLGPRFNIRQVQFIDALHQN